jgi:hypothetical protein
MSSYDVQFADMAMPLLDERLADDLVLWVGGNHACQKKFRGIVHRASDPSGHEGTATKAGRKADEYVQIQITTCGVFPGVDDAIQLPDRSVTQVIRQFYADPSGQFPLVICKLPHGISSKESRARP